jgi:hypothetical protein
MKHIGSRAECDALQAIADKLHGPYPRPPTAIVAATKKSLVTEWDGNGPRPFGWIEHHVTPIRHPDKELWAIELPDADPAREGSKLEATERALLAARRATAARALDADWTTDGSDSDRHD